MKITEKDILSFNFYTYKQPFTGSCHGMRYRIVCQEVEEEGEKKSVFFVSTWPEPYAYDHTPNEQIINQEFTFDKEGYSQVLAWLNEKLPEYSEMA